MKSASSVLQQAFQQSANISVTCRVIHCVWTGTRNHPNRGSFVKIETTQGRNISPFRSIDDVSKIFGSSGWKGHSVSRNQWPHTQVATSWISYTNWKRCTSTCGLEVIHVLPTQNLGSVPNRMCQLMRGTLCRWDFHSCWSSRVIRTVAAKNTVDESVQFRNLKLPSVKFWCGNKVSGLSIVGRWDQFRGHELCR